MKTLAILLIAGLIWCVGLFAFASRVERSTPALDPEAADAVVALTGRSTARLKVAMDLLLQRKGQRLLISGVNPAATREDIRDVTQAYNRIYDCCVDLGWRAEDTVGNAEETAAWARSKGYGRIIVVTADFHMPRALLELRAVMPEGVFVAHPIATEQLDARRWERSPRAAKFMIGEFNKYLVVLGREAFLSLGPRDQPDTSRAVAARS